MTRKKYSEQNMLRLLKGIGVHLICEVYFISVCRTVGIYAKLGPQLISLRLAIYYAQSHPYPLVVRQKQPLMFGRIFKCLIKFLT